MFWDLIPTFVRVIVEKLLGRSCGPGEEGEGVYILKFHKEEMYLIGEQFVGH